MNIMLKNPLFRKLSCANLLSVMGDSLFYLALITYASQLNNYALAISLIAISETIPDLLGVVFGYLADRTKHKFPKIILSAFLRMFLYGLVGFLFTQGDERWSLVLIVILINFISDLIGDYSSGLVSPILQRIVDSEQLDEALGASSGLKQVASLLAQFIGVALLGMLSYNGLALLNAISFGLAGLIFLSMKNHPQINVEPDEVPEQLELNFRQTFKEATSQIKQQPRLFTMIFQIALINGILACLAPALEIILVQHPTQLIYSYPFTITLIGTFLAAGVFSGGLFGVRFSKNITLEALVSVSSFIAISLFISMQFFNVWAILGLILLLSCTATICSAKLTAWLMNSVQPEILASSIGIINTILTVMTPIVLLVFSTLINLFSMTIAIDTMIVLSIIVMSFNIFHLNKRSKLEKQNEDC